jgi:hypothetical protein
MLKFAPPGFEKARVARSRRDPRPMESVNDIKEALSARSRTATLDELRSEGRKRVRLIRAEHVAQMISDAVHSAIEQSGLLAPEAVEGLVEKSRQEFRSILKEREQEVQRAREVEEQLAEREQELVALRQRCEGLAASLEATQAALAEREADLRAAAAAPAPAAPGPVAAATPAAAGPSSDVLLALVHEMANMKAGLMQQQPAAAAPDLTAALDKLAGTLNDRLETLGRKMGVSSAVGGDAPVDFGGLFKTEDKGLESNMENIQVKQKAGGGIAANLAKLKKLKGGG